MNINWIDYVDEGSGFNVLHLLIKNRKVGTLIQVTKLLSGKKMTFVRNRFIRDILEKEEIVE